MPKKPINQQSYICKCNRQEPGPDTTGGISCHWCLGVIETVQQIECGHEVVNFAGECDLCGKKVQNG